MKTIEIFLVIIFTTIFLMTLLQKQFSSPVIERSNYLIELEKNSEFRDYLSANSGCFNSTTTSVGYIRQYLPSRFDYLLCISSGPNSLPESNVNVNALFFTGNTTSAAYKPVKLYYWII